MDYESPNGVAESLIATPQTHTHKHTYTPPWQVQLMHSYTPNLTCTHNHKHPLLFSPTDAISLFIHKYRSYTHTDTLTHTRYKQNTQPAGLRLQGGFLLVAVTMADVIRPSSSAPHSRGPQGRRNHGNGRPEVSRYNWATAALPVCLQSGGSQRDCLCVCVCACVRVHLWGCGGCVCVCLCICVCVCLCACLSGNGEREREREREREKAQHASQRRTLPTHGEKQ